MALFKEFISTYGTTILYSILTAIAGYLGVVIKNLYKKYVNNKTMQEIARTVVLATEQLYKNLSGEEKLQKALEAASEMLAEHDIHISDFEIRMLIEAAVSEFNDSFNKAKTEGGKVEDLEIEEEIDWSGEGDDDPVIENPIIDNPDEETETEEDTDNPDEGTDTEETTTDTPTGEKEQTNGNQP